MFDFIGVFFSNLTYALIIPGLCFGVLMIVVSLFIPISLGTYKVPMQILGIVLVVFFTFQSGRFSEHNKYEAKALADRLVIVQLEKKSADIGTVVVTKYIDRISVVEKIKEVKTNVYITKEADSQCVISPNISADITRLLNGSGQGVVPEPPGTPDATTNPPSEPLKLSDIADNTKINYMNSAKNRIQLEELQNWIREQAKLYNN